MRILSMLPFSPLSPQYGGAERQMHSLHKRLGAKFECIPVWGVPFWGPIFDRIDRSGAFPLAVVALARKPKADR